MMFSYEVSTNCNLFIMICILSVSEGQMGRTTMRPSTAALNPCQYYNSRYSYAIIDCIWRDLPSNMLARYNPRFKKLVHLDDDGVFKLLCQSIEQRGDLLVKAFANEYSKADERRLFLEVVDACHIEVMDAVSHIDTDKDSQTATKLQNGAASGMSSNERMMTTLAQSASRRTASDGSRSTDRPH